jgi:thiol-disulfide isomerase/thioredoxin
MMMRARKPRILKGTRDPKTTKRSREVTLMPKSKGRAISRTESLLVQGGRIGVLVLVILSFCFGGLVWFAGDEIRTIEDTYFGYDRSEKIAKIPCLGCMALNPVAESDFTKMTRDNRTHSQFVLDILMSGPVFLHFRTDACPSCDRSEPFLEELEQEYKDRVTFVHINLDHVDEVHVVNNTQTYVSMTYSEAYNIYKTYNLFENEGVPMFVVITLVEGKVDGHRAMVPEFKPYLGEILPGTLDDYREDIDYALGEHKHH